MRIHKGDRDIMSLEPWVRGGAAKGRSADISELARALLQLESLCRPISEG